VSFGTAHRVWVVRYVERQKEHHAAGRLQERLERTWEPEEADRSETAAPR